MSRDVTFREDIFPFQSMKRTADSPSFLKLQDDQIVHQASPTHMETQHAKEVVETQSTSNIPKVLLEDQHMLQTEQTDANEVITDDDQAPDFQQSISKS